MLVRTGKKFATKKTNYCKKLRCLTNKCAQIHKNIQDISHRVKKSTDIINEVYSLIYDKFDEIHNEIINSTTKKEDVFLELISTVEERGYILLEQLENTDSINISIKKDTKETINQAIEKIIKHKKLYKTEKNNALCRLSNKIGSDITLHVNSFIYK
jgi:SpoVK/Ycf46/Vps4 family AAA+-type ATPase